MFKHHETVNVINAMPTSFLLSPALFNYDQLRHPSTIQLSFFVCILFSRNEATLYEGVAVRRSVGWSVGWSVASYFFGLLRATNAVYMALFLVTRYHNR